MLIVAGLPSGWACAMKQSAGVTRPGWSAPRVVAMAAIFALLSVAIRMLRLGAACTIRTGIGAVGAFPPGKPANLPRIVAAVMIVGSLVMMTLADP